MRRLLSFAAFAILTGSAINAAAQSVSVGVVGAPQTVFSYASDACEETDIPDAPARAWHMAGGWVSLLASHYVSRRAIGGTLDLVRHDCSVVYNSHSDPVQADYRYHEWLIAPYALDPPPPQRRRKRKHGKHRRHHSIDPADNGVVISIVHSEWYGDLVDQACSDPPSGWVNALALATSQNDGATFAESAAGYLLRYEIIPLTTVG